MFCTTISASLSLIATFASHTPPPAVKRPIKVHSDRSNHEVWITPLRNECSTLAYTTPDDGEFSQNNTDLIHYFLYTFDSVILQTMWAKNLNVSERATVFEELREWYKDVSNNNLTLNTTDVYDVVAWHIGG